MEIKIDRNLLIMFIEKYYREQLDFNGKVEIRLVNETVGYYGDKVNKLDIGINGFVNLAGKEVECVVKIEEDDMKNIINFYLQEQGYNVIKIENDIEDEHEYGCCHATGKIFRGVKVKVKKDLKLKVKKEGE